MNTLIKGRKVRFDDTYLHVELDDGRIISTPISWYDTLQNASLNQLSNYHLICRGTGIEWPELDFHLSIESMLLSASHEKVA